MKLTRQLLFLLGLVVFFMQACAKPNYQDTTAVPTETTDNNKPSDPSSPATEKPQEKNCELYLSKAQICLHVQWLQKPNTQSNAAFTLTFTQGKTNQPVSMDMFENLSQNLKIILWMPSMGHGSVPVIIKKNIDSTPPSLTIERVYFIMPGDWEIRFQLKETENTIDETHISLFI